MSTNILDYTQVIKQVYDPTTESLKTTPSSSTSFAIELDATDGDSVAVQAQVTSATQTAVDNTYASEVIAATNISGYSTLDLYIKTATTITGPQALTVHISPVASGDVWIATTLTATPSGTAGVVVKGTAITNVVALRAKVLTASALTSGTYDVYLLAKGN